MYTPNGYPDVFQLKEVEKPTPKDNEVLVKVRAASVNSWDWDYMKGTFLIRLSGLLKPIYRILGADIAGIVEKVGKNVKELSHGDEVFGDISVSGWGGFAEYVCVRENILALKPDSMTFEEAAAIPQAAVLALQGLNHNRQIQPGQKVLINGAGGGVGTFAIQIAKSMGAEVTGVDKTGKMDMMRSLGADHVIDYTKEDFTKSGKHYDFIFDVAAYHSVFDYKRVLNPNGKYVMIGGSTGRIFQIMFLAPLISRFGSKEMGVLMHRPNKKDLNKLKELFEAGKVMPVIDRHYPLSEVAEAFRYFGEGQVIGKLVIKVAED